MEEINIDEVVKQNTVKIIRVEFKCNKCGTWEENETGLDFYKPTLKNVLAIHKKILKLNEILF